MTASDSGSVGGPAGGRLVRAEANWQRATFLELFFDLVFVFALNQVSARLVDDFGDGDRLRFGEAGATLLLFLVLWALWVSTVQLTSRIHPDSPLAQIEVFISMAGAAVMAVAVAQGFEARALLFAAAYVAARFGRLLLSRALLGRGSPNPPFPGTAVLLIAASAPPWLVGGLVDDPLLRGALWVLAAALDSAGFAVGLRRYVGEPIAGEHLAERLQQFLLITLGEAIFVACRAFSDSDFTTRHGVAFGLAFVATILLWRIYFFRAGFALPVAITRARSPSRQSEAVAGSHLLMIAGVVLTGVGFELYITEPLGDARPQWLLAVLGGPALFLIGRAPFEFQVFGRVSRSRLIGLLGLGLLAPVTWHSPPLAAGGGAVAVLAGIAGTDAWHARGRPPETAAPPS